MEKKNELKSKNKYEQNNERLSLFIYIIIIILLILSKCEQNLIQSNYSYIEIKILNNEQIRDIKVINLDNRLCKNNIIPPNEIHINGINQTEIQSIYKFTEKNNSITLIWYEQLKTTACMFYYCNKLNEIDLSKFDSSLVTDMHKMFYLCQDLNSLDLTSFNTSNVQNMSYMFSYCRNLYSLKLSSFNTFNVQDMSRMFEYCGNLNSLDLSIFFTDNVKNMDYIFWYCSKLNFVDVKNFDTSKVTSMKCIFYYCSSLSSLNLSNFNTSLITDMSAMFYGCKMLTKLDLKNFNTFNVKNMNEMFRDCYSLISLNLSNFDTSNSEDMSSMFCGCESLESLNLSNFDTSLVTDMTEMFCNCSSLRELNLSNFNFSNVLQISEAFENCTKLEYIDFGESVINIKKISYGGIFYFTPKNLSIFSKNETWINLFATYNITMNCIDNLTDYEIKSLRINYYFDGICRKCDYMNCYQESKYINDNSDINSENNIYCFKYPTNYYYNFSTHNCKECYKSCERCTTGGNDIKNACSECKDGYYYQINYKNSRWDMDSYKSCYNNKSSYCSFYNNDKSKCIEDKNCKYIENKTECKDDCTKDPEYKYEFEKICYKENPNDTIYNSFINESILSSTYDLFSDYYSNSELSEDIFTQLTSNNIKDTIINSESMIYTDKQQ